MQNYAIVYAKIVETKDNGIMIDDVFFGGIGSSIEEAEQIARECVNTIKGGTILARVLELTGPEQVVEVLYAAADNFEKITKQMIEAQKTIENTQNRKRR